MLGFAYITNVLFLIGCKKQYIGVNHNARAGYCEILKGPLYNSKLLELVRMNTFNWCMTYGCLHLDAPKLHDSQGITRRWYGGVR